MTKQCFTSQAGFTLIEVGMGALVLVVGFIGMIQALAITSGMLDQGRRQAVATQILTHEIEQLRLKGWSDISTLSSGPSGSNWSSATAYSVGNVARYQGGWFRCIAANTNQAPPHQTYWISCMAWDSTATYTLTDLVSYNGTWYRCILGHATAQTPPNATYWETYAGPIANTGVVNGATFYVTRTTSALRSATGAGYLNEVTFTVTWLVTTSRLNPDGTNLIFAYSRTNSTFYGKNGLNVSYQRS